LRKAAVAAAAAFFVRPMHFGMRSYIVRVQWPQSGAGTACHADGGRRRRRRKRRRAAWLAGWLERVS
jgi:hypothetical protein